MGFFAIIYFFKGGKNLLVVFYWKDNRGRVAFLIYNLAN